jgi:hypothetical protein
LVYQVILDGDRELVHQRAGHPDRRTCGHGHGQRVPDADHHLPGLSGARRGEPDPRCRLRGGVPAPWPGGQRGVKLVDVDAGHRHAGGAQQARGDRLGGLGESVIIIPAPVQAVPFRPVQPHRQCPAAGIVGEHHERREEPESAAGCAFARPWLGVRDSYCRHDSETIRAGTKRRLRPSVRGPRLVRRFSHRDLTNES